MSVLTKKDIISLLEKKELEVSPPIDGYQLQPVSIDLRIGWSFYLPYTWKFTDKGRVAVVADYMDYSTTHENFQLLKLKPGQYFEVLPGEAIIASTLEKITLKSDTVMGMLSARSSASRRGLSIESGVINPHYSGHLIIPMQNNSHHVLKIYPGERLCQVTFQELKSPLTSEQATKHGLQDAKYQTATPYGLDAKLDDQDELDLLKAGNLDLIKEKYQINVNTQPPQLTA